MRCVIASTAFRVYSSLLLDFPLYSPKFGVRTFSIFLLLKLKQILLLRCSALLLAIGQLVFWHNLSATGRFLYKNKYAANRIIQTDTNRVERPTQWYETIASLWPHIRKNTKFFSFSLSSPSCRLSYREERQREKTVCEFFNKISTNDWYFIGWVARYLIALPGFFSTGSIIIFLAILAKFSKRLTPYAINDIGKQCRSVYLRQLHAFFTGISFA